MGRVLVDHLKKGSSTCTWKGPCSGPSASLGAHGAKVACDQRIVAWSDLDQVTSSHSEVTFPCTLEEVSAPFALLVGRRPPGFLATTIPDIEALLTQSRLCFKNVQVLKLKDIEGLFPAILQIQLDAKTIQATGLYIPPCMRAVTLKLPLVTTPWKSDIFFHSKYHTKARQPWPSLTI